MQLDIFDYAESLQKRDEGIQSILAGNVRWSDVAIDALAAFARKIGRQFTMEDFKAAGMVPEPDHHNAWGALCNVAARKGLIRSVGFARAKSVKAHARVISVWEYVGA